MKYNLCQVFIETKDKYPNEVALVTSEGEFTYHKLWKDIVGLALFFKEQGIKRGQRIMVVKENGYATIVSFWAILFCGGTVSLISHRNQISKIMASAENCEPLFLIFDNSLMVDKVFPELVKLSQKFLTVDPSELPSELNALFCGDLKSLLIKNNFNEDRLDWTDIISEDIAAILYTSGSTGNQKGVVLTHGNMLFSLTSIISYLNLQKEDTILSTIPLSFDYGLYQMLMGFSLGAKLVLEEENIWSFDLLRKVEKFKGTVLPVVPTLVNLFHAFIDKVKFDLSNIRMVTSTAERLKLENIKVLQMLFPNAQIFSMYGLTECKRCTFLPPHMLEEKKGSTGKAIPNSEIRIIDMSGRFSPPFEEGELVIRGANVMRGYWKNQEETDKSFHFDEFGNKWLRSGDYGYLDEDGYFFLLGRRDSVVKIRGMKVSLIELEEIISKCPSVNEVGVVTKNLQREPEQIIAFVSTKEKISLNEVQKFCRENLRDFQIPSEIRFLETLPKSLNGKIDRKVLSEIVIQQ